MLNLELELELELSPSPPSHQGPRGFLILGESAERPSVEAEGAASA